jgi:hypothetical protein
MEKNHTLQIALFDVHEMNRKTVIWLLNPHFPITELERWQDVERSRAQTYIISHVELMSAKQQSVFVDWLKWTKANVIIMRHDFDLPWNKRINRLKWKRNVKLIAKPTEERLLRALRKFTPPASDGIRLFETNYAT